MSKTPRKALSLVLALAICLSFVSGPIAPNADAVAAPVLRPMEYLTRGLVAAEIPGGMFLSWRLLGNEPDGIAFNVYRDGVLIATIAPRDVQPESDYATNPGIVKENVTPTNYTDADGLITSVYEVAPVLAGIEGAKQGLSVPVLSALGTGTNANKAGVHYIPMKPAPSPVPLVQFVYRGQVFGTGINRPSAYNGASWDIVDMDFLRSFREPFEKGTPVTQADLTGWVANLNTKNTTPNRVGVATYDPTAAGYTPWAPTEVLAGTGIIHKALYRELEAEFIKYVENLDSGVKLPYSIADGKITTAMSSAYSTHDMTVADFDGDGEFEVVVKWRGTQTDPMNSEPLNSGNSTTTAPEYIDVYKLDGTLLFRVDMGYNIRAGNGHETTLFAQDFDGDGKGELMVKTGLGTRIGNWNEELQTVVFENVAADVVGGTAGLAATTDAFKSYFETANVAALDANWALLNSFTISYRTPVQGGGNDGNNVAADKRWIKTYHVGPMGPAPGGEYFTAFEYDTVAGKGRIVDSADYPFPYEGSRYLMDMYEDGTLKNWAMTPNSQRGNYSYLAFPHDSTLNDPEGYKAQFMQEKDAYWLDANPWMGAVWGDAQGNRANRYTGVTVSLDGSKWYAVSNRGYYARTTLAAFTIIDGEVVNAANFDSWNSDYYSLGGTAYDYQNRGTHQLSSSDLNGDGRDEVIFRGMTLSLNAAGDKILPLVLTGNAAPLASGLDVNNWVAGPGARGHTVPTGDVLPAGFEWAPLRHGDYVDVLPADKTNKIVYNSPSEEHLYDNIRTGEQYGWLAGATVHDPLRGKRIVDGEIVYENSLIYGVYAGRDESGGMAGNFSNRWPGGQAGTAAGVPGGVRSLSTGELLKNDDGSALNSVDKGLARNYAIWFGGGLTHMMYSGANISSMNQDTLVASTWLQTGLTSSGDRLTLKADLLGDWREDLVFRASSNRLAIVTTLVPTNYGIRTLMHDPMYRQGVANLNAGYNSVGFASFYLGDEAPLPSQRTDISIRDAFVAPAMPLNVLYTPITEDSVTITWNAVDGADGYNIYRRDSKTSTATKIATIASAGYVDTSVVAGTDYWYSVAAYNAGGESVKSKEAFIMLANDDSVELIRFNIAAIAGQGCRLRLGDLDGDGRTDILATNTGYMSADSTNPRAIYSLTAFDLEGNVMWRWKANPSGPAFSTTVSTGADEPVQIQDVDGDGMLDVVLVANPNATNQIAGDVFYILEGATGLVKKDSKGNDCIKPFTEITGTGLTGNNFNNLHDCLVLANFDGRAIDHQFVTMKNRYGNLTAFEMFNAEGEFVFNFKWRNTDAGGHMPLAVDLTGDGIDEIINNYSVVRPDGTTWWRVQGATDHVDTIQVGDILGDGGLYILFGGGGVGVSTFCYTYDGTRVWGNNNAREPQSLLIGKYRTDSTGLLAYGLDRRVRSNYPNGADGMFLIGTQGEDLYKEADNSNHSWSSIIIRVNNWTGTYAPLCHSFNRNTEAISWAGTNADRLVTLAANKIKPALYDGYFNKLFEMEDPTLTTQYRFMVMDLCGDSRDEMVGYTDAGEICIFYNDKYGEGTTPEGKLALLRSGITGVTKPQSPFMGNYSRYPSDVFFMNIENLIPAQPHAFNVTATSAYIDWIPIITADSYDLYKNGVKVGNFKDVGYQDNAVVNGDKYEVVALEGTKESPKSMPLVISGQAASLLGIAVDSRITNLANNSAAKIPVTVTAANATAPIYAGLFVDDVLVASALVVDGAAVIDAAKFNTASATVAVKAWFENEAPAVSANIPVKQLPTDLWVPVIDTTVANKTVVLFAENVSLTSTAAATINGTAAAIEGASGSAITISDVTVENDIVVIKGVKYPALYPSYSFTFTVKCGERPIPVDPDPKPFPAQYYNFMIAASSAMDGWASIRINGQSGAPVAASLYSAAQGYGIVENRAMMGRTRSGSLANAMENSWIGGGSNAWQFKVDNVPDGAYKVTFYATDVGTGSETTNNITFDINGTSLGSRAIKGSTSAAVVPEVFNVTVTGGAGMLFTFSGAQAYICGIIIEAV